MNQQYLVPANSKKSMLILGFFTVPDLIVAGVGAACTLAMFLIANDAGLGKMLLAAMPLCVGAFLVFPVPHYHNIMQLCANVLYFIVGRKKYYWKGWCVRDDEE